MNSSTVKAVMKKRGLKKKKEDWIAQKTWELIEQRRKKENTNNQLGLKDQFKETHSIQHKKGLRKVHGGTCKRNFVDRIAKDTEEVVSKHNIGTLYCITNPVN